MQEKMEGPESILNLKPGRELDALIAEKVMGFKIVPGPGELGIEVNITECKRIPHYSTDMNSAWPIAEKFNITISSDKNGQWEVYTYEDVCDHKFEEGRFSARSESAPHAICLAALKALGIT